MAPGPEILTLTMYAENNLTALFQATSKKTFDATFDNFIALHASITVNGQKVSRENYRSQLWKEHTSERSAKVEFKGIVEVPKDAHAIVQVGEVGVFYVATINRPPLLSPDVVTASLNLVVEEVKEHPKEDDKRLVTSLTQVSTEKAGISPRA